MKTLFILASVMVVLFLAAPDKAQAQKRKPTRILEGKIVRYECGDNCYLIIVDKKGKQHTGLCCGALWAWKAMPARYKGIRVRVTVGKGPHDDGTGNSLDDVDAFTKIQFLK